MIEPIIMNVVTPHQVPEGTIHAQDVVFILHTQDFTREVKLSWYAGLPMDIDEIIEYEWWPLHIYQNKLNMKNKNDWPSTMLCPAAKDDHEQYLKLTTYNEKEI